MKSNWKTAFRYEMLGYGKGTLWVLLVVVVVMLLAAVGFLQINFQVGDDVTGISKISGAGISVAIVMFIIGITGIREKLRLFSQFGLSRRTGYFVEVLTMAVMALVFSMMMELATGILQVVLAGKSNIYVGDNYQLFYLDGLRSGAVLSFGQHVISALFNACLIFVLSIVGQFFSLLFWRLGKVWMIWVAAISIPVLCNLIPWALYRLAQLVPAVGQLGSGIAAMVAGSPFWFMGLCLLLTAAVVCVNWLLLRNARIRAASK